MNAGVLNVLDQLEKSSDTPSSVLATATNHFDNIYISHYYNWRPGTVKAAWMSTGTVPGHAAVVQGWRSG